MFIIINNMVNLSVIRRPSPRYANKLTVNEDVTNILENPEEKWSTLSLKLHRVADISYMSLQTGE